jgi:fibronectin type 3 domain-containing protein
MQPRSRHVASALRLVLTASVALGLSVWFGRSDPSAQATIAYVQGAFANPQTPQTTVSVTYAAAQTAGSLNVVVVGWNDSTAQVQSVVDSKGNAYTRAVGPTVQAGTATQSIYYASGIVAAAANGNAVTVTFAPAAVYPDIRIAEYKGLDAVNPVDIVAAATGSGTSSNSGAKTTTATNALLVGASLVQTHNTAAGSGFTKRMITNPDGDILEDRIVTAVGSYSAAAPMTSGAWIMQMVAFRAASTGPDTQAPTVPGALAATATSSQIALTWTASTDNVGVTGYRVERCQGAGCTTFAQIGTPTVNSYTDSGLPVGTAYVYRVRAADAAGNLSGYSGTATATTTSPDTQPPTAPGTLTATVASSTQINLAWGAATDNTAVTGYLVERCLGAGCSTFAQIGTTSGLSYGDAGLTASTTYLYRVRATDAASNLGPYSSASATTQAGDTQPPSAPGALSATVASASQINLSWMASTDNIGVTSYRVERCPGAACTAFGQIGTSSGTTYADSGLLPSTSYSYKVRAQDAAGNLSPYSSAATAATSAAASIAFVQGNSAVPQSPLSTVTAAFTAAQSAGNLNVAVVGWNDVVAHVLSVTDTKGNPYSLAVGPTVQSGFGTQAIYFGRNIQAATAGANTVTATFDQAAIYVDLRIAEYSGLDPVNPVDVVAAGQGNSASSDSGVATTTNANDVLVGANLVQTTTSGAGTSFTQRIITNPDGDILEDRIVTSTGSYNATAPLNSGAWVMQMVAFRAAGGTPPPPPPPPDLTVTKIHTGAFSQGQVGASYTLTVNNISTGPTSGLLTISDSLPVGLTATAISGAGWTCTLATLTCTRSDVLAGSASSPIIVVTVNVAADAAAVVTNIATVSGGGETNTGNNAASDVTVIAAPDTQLPSAPGSLTAVASSGTQIDLSWGAATDNVGVVGYRVERCQGAGCTNFSKFGTLVTATTFSDTGLSVSTIYNYIARAQDAAGNVGPYTNVATATTLAINPHLVAAYSFNEGTGATVADGSGNGHAGAIASGTWTTAGKFGGALSFNGAGTVVTIPDAAVLHFTTGMTLEAWVNPTAGGSAWRDVIYKANDNFYLEASTTPAGLPVAGAIINGSYGEAYGASALALNTWTHLAATYDGSVLRFYVNGAEVSNRLQAGAILTSTNPLQIGGDGLYGQYFSGLIDEVRVYDTALKPSEIQTDMSTPIGTTTVPVVSLSTNAIDFGTQSVGVPAGPSAVTLTNTGGAVLSIASIGLTGTQSADFSQTNTCASALAISASCTISVTFTASAAGVRSGAVTIADNAPGTPHTVALTGTGAGFTIAPRVTVLTPAQTQQFTAVGQGSGSVTWLVDGAVGGSAAAGLITAAGLYTPPATPGTHTVTVTNAQSISSSATAYIVNSAGMFTHHNDVSRTGSNTNEKVLTPANVNSTSFGKLLSYQTDGISHASPLYVAGVNIPGVGLRNVVYVSTEHDSVYAFDADGLSASPLWKRSFINPAAGITAVPNMDTGECCDIVTEIGITGTPVIDPSTGTLYVVAKTKENGSYVQRLHALDITTGAEKLGGPVAIQGTVPGSGNGSANGQLAFDPLRENQRTALLLLNGVVYFGFGSHGDFQPYHGWVFGYRASNLTQVLAYSTTANAEGGGVWHSGGGLVADASGNIYFVTGDGKFDANSGGADFGDSFVKLSPSGTVLDYFTPHDQGTIDINNLDLGAGGLILLPDQPGAHPHLLVSAGKNGSIYLVNRDSFGHYTSASDANVQTLAGIFPFGTPLPGNYSSTVYFNGTLYFGPIADNVQSFRLSNGLLPTTATSRTFAAYAYPGGALAVSANGTTNAILWTTEKRGASPGTLHAYDATNLQAELYNSDQVAVRDNLDAVAKFAIPLVMNGKVFVASEGRLTVYGLLP